MQKQAILLLLNLLKDGPKSYGRIDAAGATTAARVAVQKWPGDQTLAHAATKLVSSLQQIEAFTKDNIFRYKQSQDDNVKN